MATVPSRFPNRQRPAGKQTPGGASQPEQLPAQAEPKQMVVVRFASGLAVVYGAGFIFESENGTFHLFDVEGGTRLAIVPPGTGVIECCDPLHVEPPEPAQHFHMEPEPPKKRGFFARLFNR